MQSVRFDATLAVVTLILVAIGIIMVYSSSAIIANESRGVSYLYLKKQLLWAFFGIICMIAFANISYTKMRNFSIIILFISLALLLLTFVPGLGATVGGARRWIRIGKFTFQPSEMVKPVLIFYVADALTRKQEVISSFFKGFFPILVIIGAFMFLLVSQPDLGTSIVIFISVFIIAYVCGVRVSHMFSIFLFSIPLLVTLIYKVGYRYKRILAFLSPQSAPESIGYQIMQSFIALGSGGLLGVGLGDGRQKLFYLPAPHTDFIFAIIGEELGFVGTFTICLLFVILVYRGILISLNCKDDFGRALAFGLTALIGLETVINMGVVCGLLPTKGATLPLISYGGSSLFFTLASIGILLNISMNRQAVSRTHGTRSGFYKQRY